MLVGLYNYKQANTRAIKILLKKDVSKDAIMDDYLLL